MLSTLLTLVMLASGPSGSANQVPANSGLYDLQLAFQRAQVESVDEASALPLEMAQADQRVAEALAAAQQGDQAAADKALGHYDHALTMLTEDAMSADGIDTDALMDEIDAKLTEHNKKIKGIKGDQGEDEGEDQGEEGGGNKSVCTRTDHPVAEKIAAQYGVTTDQVMGWFCGDDKMGFGKIMLVLRMSQESGKSVDEILALHASGESWGQIKHELGVIGKGHVKHNKGKGHGAANGQGNGGKNGNGHGNGGANGNGNKNGGGNGHANGGKNGGDDDGGDTTGVTDGGTDSGGGTGGDDNQNVNENANDNAITNDNTDTNTNSNENLNVNENSNTNTNSNDNTSTNDNTTPN